MINLSFENINFEMPFYTEAELTEHIECLFEEEQFKENFNSSVRRKSLLQIYSHFGDEVKIINVEFPFSMFGSISKENKSFVMICFLKVLKKEKPYFHFKYSPKEETETFQIEVIMGIGDCESHLCLLD